MPNLIFHQVLRDVSLRNKKRYFHDIVFTFVQNTLIYNILKGSLDAHLISCVCTLYIIIYYDMLLFLSLFVQAYMTMLHVASVEGHEGVVTYLLGMGATLDIQSAVSVHVNFTYIVHISIYTIIFTIWT